MWAAYAALEQQAGGVKVSSCPGLLDQAALVEPDIRPPEAFVLKLQLCNTFRWPVWGFLLTSAAACV